MMFFAPMRSGMTRPAMQGYGVVLTHVTAPGGRHAGIERRLVVAARVFIHS